MRRWALGLALVVVAALGGLVIWNQSNRVHFVQTLCEAGLPNLSRPDVVDARLLGCTVLGPRQRLTGFLFSDFEASWLTIGDRVVLGPKGFENESAWFSGTEGFDLRGGDALDRELEVRRRGLCGGRLAKVTVEGWMTISPGGFGHLNQAEQEFHADRVVEVTAPSDAELVPHQYGVAPHWPPETVAFCRDRERSDPEGL